MKDTTQLVQVTVPPAAYPEGTHARIRTQDRVWIRRAGVLPVVSGEELRLIFDHLSDDLLTRTALLLIAFQVMRPIEVTRLRWQDLRYSQEQRRFVHMRHLVYKPRRRTHHSTNSWFFQELEKPIQSLEVTAALRQLYLKYGSFPERPVFGRTPVSLHEEGPTNMTRGKVFPWSSQECLTRRWAKIRRDIQAGLDRGSLSPDLRFVLDKRLEEVKNEYNDQGGTAQYRITPYSFRRFGMSWHYYMTFNQDMVALSRWVGHQDIETTAGYVMPKEAIGLTQDMINDKISIDEFIFGQGKKQATLAQFDPREGTRFLPVGQSSLWDFEA